MIIIVDDQQSWLPVSLFVLIYMPCSFEIEQVTSKRAKRAKTEVKAKNRKIRNKNFNKTKYGTRAASVQLNKVSPQRNICFRRIDMNSAASR